MKMVAALAANLKLRKMKLQTKQWKLIAVFALLACCLFLGSCSSEPDGVPPIDGDPIVAAFNAGIAAPATRASGTSWELNDEIGIFMLKSGGSLTVGSDVLAVNKQYYITEITQPIEDAKDNLKPKTEAETIYLQPGVPFDFIAYYPWQATANLSGGVNFPISLANQMSGSASHDLLYTTTSRTNVKSNAISMVFSHKLANITIQVERAKGVNATAYVNKQAVLSGMPTVASFNLADGTTFSGVGTVADITSSRADDNGNLYEVIVIPQAAGAYPNRMITFSGLGKDYRWSIPNGFAFESGKRYTYRFTITDSGLEQDGDVIIEAWTEIDLGSTGSWGSGIADILDIETVDIQPGTFMMGQADIPIASPVHQVTLTKGFKMSKYEITNAQYCEFLNILGVEGIECKVDATLFSFYDVDGNEWVRSTNGTTADWGLHWDGKKWTPAPGRDEHPITHVSWYGAVAFCDFVKGSLPTEAQWEYACRAGTTTIYYFGDSDTNLEDYGWYQVNAPNGPKTIGQKIPNPWGLYDIIGNVWEWCVDLYNPNYYGSAPVTDPVNLDNPDVTISRSLRGGRHGNGSVALRSAGRDKNVPASIHVGIGIRPIFPL